VHYLSIAPQFFLLIALLQVWLFGVYLRLENSIGVYTINEALILLAALILMRSKNLNMHLAGVIIFYAIFLVSMALNSMGFNA
jgi:hypothetical protein